ncbi:SAVED domain-containing protein [Variovorax sp. J22G73]|nr:SAVED domain-containing protein [Variovorax sp. J22G73]MDM0103035.1 SAVED domain-containing protein [Variovorax sp. J22G73]
MATNAQLKILCHFSELFPPEFSYNWLSESSLHRTFRLTIEAIDGPNIQMNSLTDSQLAASLKLASQAGAHEYLLVKNAYQAGVYSRSKGASDWQEIGLGDLEELATAQLKLALAAKRVFTVDIEGSMTVVDFSSNAPMPLSLAQLSAWLTSRDAVTKGRKGEVDRATEFEVASVAAWRCQMEGCGESLREHFSAGRRANYGYLAHIVASSPSGPRGDPAMSAALATVAENIMLLCDKCHRLIDRVAPDQYSADRLLAMREQNIAEVNRLLGALRFPAARAIVVGGNIEGQSVGFNLRAVEQAMWARKLRLADHVPLRFMANASNASVSTQAHYWQALFHSLKTEIPVLQNQLSGNAEGTAAAAQLAVFPTHVMSALALTGRLIGNATTVHLFQPNRNAAPDALGERWAWPATDGKPADPKRFRVEVSASSGAKEAGLLLYLTAALPDMELPFVGLPMVRIVAGESSHTAIAGQPDLDLLAVKIDEALRLLQDIWRVERIHCVLIAPASACVLFGQKLQARHHAPVRLYERERTLLGAPQRGAFVPTIDILPAQVSLPDSSASISFT